MMLTAMMSSAIVMVSRKTRSWVESGRADEGEGAKQEGGVRADDDAPAVRCLAGRVQGEEEKRRDDEPTDRGDGRAR